MNLKSIVITIEYTGSKHTEKTALENGFKRLTGMELKEQIINKTIYGDYPMGYTFVTHIYESGGAVGRNNAGSEDYGQWSIDEENHTISLQWELDWIDTITRAYEVNGTIEFYDVDTGNWRTTFKTIESLKEE